MAVKHIQEIRAFNRFYTSIIGVLDKYILHSKYTLPEVRIMYELSYNDDITASEISSKLKMDKGYLSKMILKLEKRKLLSRKSSPHDGRSSHLYLTSTGKKDFAVLDKAANDEIREILSALPDDEQDKLIGHMLEIKKILNRPQEKKLVNARNRF